MSSKNVKTDQPRRWSLGTRLMLWFACSAFALVFTTSAFLYWKLTDSLDREDDSVLLNKAWSVNILLDRMEEDAAAFRWEIETEEEQRNESRTFVRILEAGKEVVATTGMSDLLPSHLFPAAVDAREDATGVAVTATSGAAFRALRLRLPARPGATRAYTFEVALDTGLEEVLLRSYRRSLWVVLLLALTASCVGGFYIARRGMRPIAEMSETVRSIGSRNLDERIDRSGLPEELDSLAETCNSMLARLEDAFSRISRFSSDIAHELRTPISNLRGEAEVALSKPRTLQEYRDALTSTLEESAQVARLIDGLLFLARAENPDQLPHRELIDVEAEVAAVVEFYEAAASDAGVTLVRHTEPGLRMFANRALLQRVLGNLIENALAHTPPHGEVSVIAQGVGAEIDLRVTDTGCGISAEQLPLVFDRFHRVDGARSRDGGGAGLGLSVVESVVRLHGGTIKIESEVGRGTTVRIVLSKAPTGVTAGDCGSTNEGTHSSPKF